MIFFQIFRIISFQKLTVPLLVLVLFCSIKVSGQTTSIKLSADSLLKKSSGYPLTNQPWLFHTGDSKDWAKPDLDVSIWKPTYTNFGEGKPLANWEGEGWFRLWIRLDSSLIGKTLGLRVNHDGASEIYVDGIYKTGFGKIGSSKSDMVASRPAFEIIPVQFNDAQPHLIAIRYANYNNVFPDFIGFQTWIGDYNYMHQKAEKEKSLFESMNISVAIQLSLALLHLFLFLFYPRQKINLYYVIFSVLFAGTSWAIAMGNLAPDPFTQLLAFRVFWITAILSTVSGWFMLRKVANAPPPRWKTITICLVSFVYLIKHVFFIDAYPVDGFSLAFLLIIADGLWPLYLAIKKGQPRIWLIGLGMLIIALLYFFVGADIFGWWTSYPMRCFAMSMGILSFPFCFSIYLALDFAGTNNDLSLRLIEVEQLSAKALAQEAEKLELITHQAEKLEHTVLERTAEVQRQADKLTELDRVKSRFFINLTHEFRTPLTLISGPAKQILSRDNDDTTLELAAAISRNSDRLLQLINQLLDLSKLEAGKMELNETAVEIIGLTRRNFLSFSSLAGQKQITLTFSADWDVLWLNIDRDKFEMILVNLVSNAVKFTGEEGLVAVQLVKSKQTDDPMFELIVTDTGIGIPEAKMPYIFDRFYQVDPSDTRAQEGTGIGLAITKELTQLMNGDLLVESIENAGTEMRVRLPIRTTPAPANEPVLLENNQVSPMIDSLPFTAVGADAPVVLIIEDNKELRTFIGSLLKSHYRILEAVNGAEGVRTTLDHVPDLVITDLMMPVMDGYQVCAALKQNQGTSHIPIIILTAKADIESRITGLETRADAYLSKPFDERELLVTIKNLLLLRAQLRVLYSKGNAWLTATATLPSMEQVFLEKVRKAVEAHLDDEQYSVELLGEDVGLSRTQLHRKLKGLIDQSPGDLIRIIRLQRAYELLKNRAGTVAEVGYMVGFGNPNNFSTSFSRHFGFAPSEAIKN